MPGDPETALLFCGAVRISDNVGALTGVAGAAASALRAGDIPPPPRPEDESVEPPCAPTPRLQGGATSGGAGTLSAPSVSFSLCQYPIGEVGDAAFHFCAAPIRDGSSYCPDHHAKCHTRAYSAAERKAWKDRQRKNHSAGGRLTITGYGDPEELGV